jgi:transposase-like protein
VVGAEYGRVSPGRVGSQRNGYRHRDLDTRVGTIEVAVREMRKGASKSQVSRMAAELRRARRAVPSPAAGCRRPVHVRRSRRAHEGARGRTGDKTVVLLATGVNGDGHREVLGIRVPIPETETGAAWNEL